METLIWIRVVLHEVSSSPPQLHVNQEIKGRKLTHLKPTELRTLDLRTDRSKHEGKLVCMNILLHGQKPKDSKRQLRHIYREWEWSSDFLALLK